MCKDEVLAEIENGNLNEGCAFSVVGVKIFRGAYTAYTALGQAFASVLGEEVFLVVDNHR